MGIRTKFFIWFNSTIVVLFLFVAHAMYYGVTKAERQAVDTRLMAMGVATRHILETGPVGRFLVCDSREFEGVIRAFFGFKRTDGFIRAMNADGMPTSCTSHTMVEPKPLAVSEQALLRSGTHFYRELKLKDDAISNRMRVLHLPLFSGRQYVGHVEIGGYLEKLEDLQHALLYLFLVIFPMTLALSNILGYYIFDRGLRGIVALSSTLKSMRADDLSLRLPQWRSNDEVGDLYGAINGMLDRLEKSFDLMRQFSADASHELRTPLTIMRGEIEVALRSRRSVEEYEDTLVSILEELERTTRIVEDLLLISKGDAGEAIVNHADIDITGLVSELCEQLAMVAEDRDVSLRCDAGPPLVISADGLRLRQVFSNLVMNAIRYNRAGGSIDVRVIAEDGGAAVFVRDTGIGIKAEDLHRIFDRFYRTDKSRTRDVGGTGIGLSICKLLVEQHGGYIEAESVPGEGSTFKVWLPMGSACLHTPGQDA